MNLAIFTGIIKHKNIVILSVIIGIALGLRFYYFIGPSQVDPFDYIQAASEIKNGSYANSLALELNAQAMRWLRYALILPTWLGLSVFGSNDLAVIWFPFLCSITSIVLIYLIGNQLWDPTAGLIAAIMLAALSWLDIISATQLLPAAIINCFCLLAIYLAILTSGSEERYFSWYLFSCGLSLGVIYASRFNTPILVLPVILGIGLWKRWHWYQWGFLIVGILAIPLAEGIYFSSTIDDPFFRLRTLMSLQTANGGRYLPEPWKFFDMMYMEDTFSIFFYLFLAAGLFLILKGDWFVLILMGWWLFAFLILEISYDLSTVASKMDRMISLLWIPAALVIGRFVGIRLHERRRKYLELLVLLILIVIIYATKSMWASQYRLFLSEIKYILLGLLALTFIVVFIERENFVISLALCTIILLFLAAHSALWSSNFQAIQQKFNQPYHQASQYLEKISPEYVYTASMSFGFRYHYYSGANRSISRKEFSDTTPLVWASIGSKQSPPVKTSDVILVSMTQPSLPLDFLNAELLEQYETRKSSIDIYRLPALSSKDNALDYLRLAMIQSLSGHLEDAKNSIARVQKICSKMKCSMETHKASLAIITRVLYQSGKLEQSIDNYNKLLGEAQINPDETNDLVSQIIPPEVVETHHNEVVKIYESLLLDRQVQGNKLENGGFESSYAGWRSPAHFYSIEGELETKCAYSGEVGLMMTGKEDKYQDGFNISLPFVEPGRYYIIGAMVHQIGKVIEAQGISVGGKNMDGIIQSQPGIQLSLSPGEWKPVINTFQAEDWVEGSTYLKPLLFNGKGPICVDDVFVVPLSQINMIGKERGKKE